MRISDWSSDVCSSDLHPRRENVAFYADPAAARAAGFRACLRCKPDEVGRDRIAVARAIALIEAAEEAIALDDLRSEEHTSELQSLMRISYAVFCLKKKNDSITQIHTRSTYTKSKHALS